MNTDRAGPDQSADDVSEIVALATRAWTAMQAFVSGEDRRAALRAELDLGPGRVGVLIKLADGPMILREIADAADVDPPTATVAVDLLQRRGLVRRDPHPEDNRRKLVRLTDAGIRAAEKARRILTDPPLPLAALDADDLACLVRLLATLNPTPQSAPIVPDQEGN